MILILLIAAVPMYDFSFDGNERISFRQQQEPLSAKMKMNEKIISSKKENFQFFDKMNPELIFETNETSVFSVRGEIPSELHNFTISIYEDEEHHTFFMK